MDSHEVSSKIEPKYYIDTELSIGNLKFLPEYLRQHYLVHQEKYRTFWDIRIENRNTKQKLAYKVMVPNKKHYVEVVIETGIPIEVTMKLSNINIQNVFLDQLYEDLLLIVQMFEEEVRNTTLYFAFVPGEEFVPEQEQSRLILKLLTDSMLPLYVGLMTLTFIFFLFFEKYAPLLFVTISSILTIFSAKLIIKTGNWQITKDQPEIHLLQYHLTPYEFAEFQRKYSKKIPTIRKEIYNATIASDNQINCATAGNIFSNYGINCKTADFSIKKINLFQIVTKAANMFNLPLPKIVVTNTTIPNAAAAGITPSLGTILITTGLLTQLEEDELINILGHELSHLKAHDPLVMFLLSNIEYLFRFYVFWPYLFILGFYSYWLYSFFAIGLIYFFGKFLEGRADLDSAKMIEQPKVLAEALKKIAFTKLLPVYKREPFFRNYRRAEWLQFEPHPPLYFRVARLEMLKEPKNIKHTFLNTIKESFKSIIQA